MGSWEGRGAKPSDFEPPGSPQDAPTCTQIDNPKSRLSAENCDFLIPGRPVPGVIEKFRHPNHSRGRNSPRMFSNPLGTFFTEIRTVEHGRNGPNPARKKCHVDVPGGPLEALLAPFVGRPAAIESDRPVELTPIFAASDHHKGEELRRAPEPATISHTNQHNQLDLW